MDDLYASLYEHVGCAVVRVREGVIQFANPVAACLLRAKPREHLAHPLLDDLFMAVTRGLMAPPLRFELSLFTQPPNISHDAPPRRSAQRFEAILAPAPWYEGELLLVLSRPSHPRRGQAASAEFLDLLAADMQKPLDEILKSSSALAASGAGSGAHRIHAQALELREQLRKAHDFTALAEPCTSTPSERLLLGQLVAQTIAELRGRLGAQADSVTLNESPLPSPAVYGSRRWLHKGVESCLLHGLRHALPGHRVEVTVGASGASAFVKVQGLRHPAAEAAKPASLDLALSRRVAEVHGGSLLIEMDAERRGGELIMELPVGAPTSQDTRLSVEQATRFGESLFGLREFSRHRQSATR